MKWCKLGTAKNYTFWYRNPDKFESNMWYTCTLDDHTPQGEGGYGCLDTLMKCKNVKEIIPVTTGDN